MLLENAYIFEEGLKNIGYNLKSFSYENEKINKEYSLKAVDRRI